MISPHPDPRVEEVLERNRRAIAEAVQAPPPDIADDLPAYLDWLQQPPSHRPTVRPGSGAVRPAIPIPKTKRAQQPPSAPSVRLLESAPVCGCGALLDRDGSCPACPKETRHA